MVIYPKCKKVLFCTDFSKISDCAFDYAFGIAKRDDAVLYILHVLERNPQWETLSKMHLSEEQYNKLQEDNQNDLERMFHEKYLNRIMDKTKAKIVTKSGREDDEILEFAENEKVDVIVLGTKGKKGMEHTFLGSVAEKVIRRSPIPVLVIPCKDKTGLA